MSYSYQSERSAVFTEEGQIAFLRIRDNAHRLIKQSGAATMGNLMLGPGNSWTMMACVHRKLVEGVR